VTEVRQTDATAENADSTGDAVEVSGAQSVEEVEAYWRNRTSGIQKAHNAETAALHAQMEQMRAAPVAAPEGESAEAARSRALETELQQERAARQSLELRTRYPYAADVLGDEIVNLTPAKLAAIEAGGDGGQGGPPVIRDPNAARRNQTGVQSPQAKPLNEKTKDELLADLRQAAPYIQAEAREGL
jgi:hypothetical protein